MTIKQKLEETEACPEVRKMIQVDLDQSGSLEVIGGNGLTYPYDVTNPPNRFVGLIMNGTIPRVPFSLWHVTITFFSAHEQVFVQCLDLNRKSRTDSLVGGFNPFEKYESNWIIFPNTGENKKYVKPPPSTVRTWRAYIFQPPVSRWFYVFREWV